MGRSTRKVKHAKKVALPRDRHGMPIDVGDIITWDDGTVVKVDTLTYLGEEFADTIGSWIINIETDGYDNPQGGEVIRKAVEQ